MKNKINASEIQKIKKNICKKYNLSSIPSNKEIYNYCIENKIYHESKILNNFITKPTRTISGVSVIAIMTSPSKCPHGRCIPCPGGPNSMYNSPQSYTGKEPASMRAFQNNFDPYLQVYSRLNQLYSNGHNVSKNELIIMGGTFSSRSLDYQEWFIKRALEAMNDFGKYKIDNIKKIYNNKINNTHYNYLENVIKENEKSSVRNIGTTFETRPDYISDFHINEFLKLGGTKVEIGVQSISDNILEFIKRGHSVKSTIISNKKLRDSGFKIGFHMMLGLHNKNLDDELEEYKELYENENFMPDYLKIYPTLVIKDTELYELWKKNKYEPLNEEEGIKLIQNIKKILPRWTRLQRIQRDIPSNQIIAGIKKSNIREIVQELLDQKNDFCKCIRCREIGHRLLNNKIDYNMNLKISTKITKYYACDGVEYFIESLDIKTDTLIGFCRLRFPSKDSNYYKEKISFIRELHIYGKQTSIGDHSNECWQHRGYGYQLIKIAEELSIENDYHKIAINSGIGTREYYRKYNYIYNGKFMIKNI